MPVYDYRCEECGKVYDIYHKSREAASEVVRPTCGSKNHKKLISAPAVSMGSGSSMNYSPASSCETGGCCGGSCNVN